MGTTVQPDIAIAAHMFRSFGDPTRLAILTELLRAVFHLLKMLLRLAVDRREVPHPIREEIH